MLPPAWDVASHKKAADIPRLSYMVLGTRENPSRNQSGNAIPQATRFSRLNCCVVMCKMISSHGVTPFRKHCVVEIINIAVGTAIAIAIAIAIALALLYPF